MPWRNVCVGDVLWVADDEEVPCDLLCLFCALPDRVCFIQTTNLGAQISRIPGAMTWRPNTKVSPPRRCANAAH